MVTLRVTDTAGYNGFSNYLLLSARQFQGIQKSPVLDGASPPTVGICHLENEPAPFPLLRVKPWRVSKSLKPRIKALRVRP